MPCSYVTRAGVLGVFKRESAGGEEAREQSRAAHEGEHSWSSEGQHSYVGQTGEDVLAECQPVWAATEVRTRRCNLVVCALSHARLSRLLRLNASE